MRFSILFLILEEQELHYIFVKKNIFLAGFNIFRLAQFLLKSGTFFCLLFSLLLQFLHCHFSQMGCCIIFLHFEFTKKMLSKHEESKV